MIDKPLLLPMGHEDLLHVLSSASMYACGRGTGAETIVRDVLSANLPALTRGERTRLADRLAERYGDRAFRWRIILTDECTPGSPDTLTATPVDRRILFGCALRHDMQSDNPDIPHVWERWAGEYGTVLYANDWNLMTARDLLWEHLIPVNEPTGGLPVPPERVEPRDDRWARFYRMMIDGKHAD